MADDERTVVGNSSSLDKDIYEAPQQNQEQPPREKSNRSPHAESQSQGAAEQTIPSKFPFWREIADQGVVTDYIVNHAYPGSGTREDPYVVQWLDNDPRNPMLWSQLKKWTITAMVATSTLAIALCSSAYSGTVNQLVMDLKMSEEVATLGVSLFVLGFAIGPLLWAPLSEMFGRQIVFTVSYCGLTVFNAGCTGAKNKQTLVILRLLAGSFGSSPLTNAGGVIADMFPATQRGLATSLFAVAPFLGPVIGPIIGGFLGMTRGWKWVLGLLAIVAGAFWIIGTLFIPETYAPRLLRKRAQRLTQITGKVYVSKLEKDRPPMTVPQLLRTSLLRPWQLLFMEPIVLLLSIYMAIVYGTLYMLFSAFPIVFEQHRHWNQGVGSLSFLGVMIGMLLAAVYNIWDNSRYIKIAHKYKGFAPPEARLPPSLLASVCLPVGLFWFAWTNSPSIHWLSPIAACIPFGFGMVLVFVAVLNYLIDSYTIFAASVLAANSVLRSIFGAVFPLFTTYMYRNLGIHWASCIPAFLALLCVPFPFIFYKYGSAIRSKCRYAAQALNFMKELQARSLGKAEDGQGGNEKTGEPGPSSEEAQDYEEGEEDKQGDFEGPSQHSLARTVSRRTRDSIAPETDDPLVLAASRTRDEYEPNPYDIDVINTSTSNPEGDPSSQSAKTSKAKKSKK